MCYCFYYYTIALISCVLSPTQKKSYFDKIELIDNEDSEVEEV